MTRETRKLIAHIRAKAKRLGVKVILANRPQVNADGIKCSGYFDGENKVLKVAIGKPEHEYVQILVHEFCHMLQWADQCEAWTAHESVTDDKLSEWLEHKIELSSAELHSTIMPYINVELDCEKRVVAKIQEHNLAIDVPSYIQKSNAYVYFYHFMVLHRRWYTQGREPYVLPEVWTKMPATFADDYTFLPEEICEALKPCFAETNK